MSDMREDPAATLRGLMSDELRGLLDEDVGVGVDCEEIDRWRRLLPELDRGSRQALFDAEEHAYCRSFPDPAPLYAARWCAKEAVLKALSGFCTLTLRDVRIRNLPDGRPYAVVSAPDFARAGARVRLSITHTARTAMAAAIVLVRRPPVAAEDPGDGPLPG